MRIFNCNNKIMTNSKEAKERIKINKLLEESGWKFFDTEKEQANIQLEPNVKMTQKDIDTFGKDFETTKNGYRKIVPEYVKDYVPVNQFMK